MVTAAHVLGTSHLQSGPASSPWVPWRLSPSCQASRRVPSSPGGGSEHKAPTWSHPAASPRGSRWSRSGDLRPLGDECHPKCFKPLSAVCQPALPATAQLSAPQPSASLRPRMGAWAVTAVLSARQPGPPRAPECPASVFLQERSPEQASPLLGLCPSCPPPGLAGECRLVASEVSPGPRLRARTASSAGMPRPEGVA